MTAFDLPLVLDLLLWAALVILAVPLLLSIVVLWALVNDTRRSRHLRLRSSWQVRG